MHYWPPRRPSTMSIAVEGSKRIARIDDVSERGLQIVVTGGLEVGGRVTLVAPRFRLLRKVRWCRADHAGILLDRSLTSAEQAELAGGW